LRISPEEAAFVEELAGLLSDRPRALKRFVNVYRLLKASLPDIERASFVAAGPSSAHRICLSQLAFFTSYPRQAPLLVAKLESSRETGSLKTWFSNLGANAQDELRPAFSLIPGRESLLVEEFRRWLPLTSRYLFHRVS
jgi:hypothetical protein